MRIKTSGRANQSEELCCRAFFVLLFLFLFPHLGFAGSALAGSGTAAAKPQQVAGTLRTLRSVSEVFALTRDEARRGYPIELDVIVTYSDPEWGMMFIQERSGPTFLDVHGNRTKYAAGTHIRVDAVTGVGEFGITLATPKITVLGVGAMPAPVHRSIAELRTMAYESFRAVTEGVVHPCPVGNERVCFRIYDGDKMISLSVPEPESPAAESLLGATVRITGIAGREVDETTKQIWPRLFAENLQAIQILTPPADTLNSTPSAISKLISPGSGQSYGPLVHVRGTVSWQAPGFFFLGDGTGMVFVDTSETVSVRTGSVVDVLGFPHRGEFGLELADAVVRATASQSGSSLLTPMQTNASNVVNLNLNGRRVHLKARLIGQNAGAKEVVYQLEDGDRRFNAVLIGSANTRSTVGLPINSTLELTGVALVQSGNPAWQDPLLILIESPSDIVVKNGFGWLTLRRGLALLGLLFGVVVAPLVWVKQLRRTVRKQTAMIVTRLENEMHLETRFRRLFERNLAAVFTWKPDGTILDCNLAFARLLGFQEPQELIGRSYWDFEMDTDGREQLRQALKEQSLSNRETSLMRDDGIPIHLLANITPVEGAEGVVYETTAIDVTELRKNEQELQRARDTAVKESLNDSLTGLPNRRFLLDALSALRVSAQQDAGMIGVLYLDLDGFKLVNDSLGHAIGDALLVEVAACLRSRIRRGDMLARIGGDEFIVIVDQLRDRDDATMLAEHLLEAISSPFQIRGHQLSIGVSIGISIFPEDATDAEELIQHADSAMYAAKREGKNRVLHYTAEIGSKMHERVTLENLLRGAIARNEISIHYQPEFDLATQKLIRFEALARWMHPTLGNIPPDKFIPIAEESGMIRTLGAYIMEKACAEAVRWQSMMPHPVQVAVNVSSIQFRHKSFVEEIRLILESTGLRPGLLQLEVTESVMLGGNPQTVEAISQIREMGISMVIDDFGTGYSNLSYLPSLSFDALKIDRSFMLNLESQPETESMIRTLVRLAHDIGMRVIIEGVETEEQLDLIRVLGANEVQGYLVGRPTPNPRAILQSATTAP